MVTSCSPLHSRAWMGGSLAERRCQAGSLPLLLPPPTPPLLLVELRWRSTTALEAFLSSSYLQQRGKQCRTGTMSQAAAAAGPSEQLTSRPYAAMQKRGSERCPMHRPTHSM